ncbi:uncharacterized protein LOC120350979 [Nilaparvata lugens]|uniref:uncharacterized protein LOC120350979 n=1 Tax=Nilaparvata lugens TaxID=108931 RepID=UPI00193D5289|nr:uncharacterized protein LOC120350979 [Nilaparvata lugens]
MIAPIRILIILCFVITGGSALWEEIAGPYDIRFSYRSNCEKRGKINLFEPIKARKLNRTHFVYSGIIDIGAPADDNLKFTCVMKNWTVNYNFNNVPALPYGEYRVEGSFIKIHQYNRRELISCTRYYGIITPKMPKSPKKTQQSNRMTNASSLITP